MRRDRVCEEFDRLREEIYAWPSPDKPKPKKPVVIDLAAPLALSPAALETLAPKDPSDV